MPARKTHANVRPKVAVHQRESIRRFALRACGAVVDTVRPTVPLPVRELIPNAQLLSRANPEHEDGAKLTVPL